MRKPLDKLERARRTTLMAIATQRYGIPFWSVTLDDREMKSPKRHAQFRRIGLARAQFRALLKALAANWIPKQDAVQ